MQPTPRDDAGAHTGTPPAVTMVSSPQDKEEWGNEPERGPLENIPPASPESDLSVSPGSPAQHDPVHPRKRGYRRSPVLNEPRATHTPPHTACRLSPADFPPLPSPTKSVSPASQIGGDRQRTDLEPLGQQTAEPRNAENSANSTRSSQTIAQRLKSSPRHASQRPDPSSRRTTPNRMTTVTANRPGGQTQATPSPRTETAFPVTALRIERSPSSRKPMRTEGSSAPKSTTPLRCN